MKGRVVSKTVNSAGWQLFNNHWFFKYKVYHIIFWCIYHYIWTIINGGKPLEVLNFIFSSPKFAFYVIFQALAVYFNLYFLIPRFLEKGRYFIYLVNFTLALGIASAIIVVGYYWHASLQHSTALELYGHSNFAYFFLTYTLPSTLTSMLLAMSVKLTKNWIESKRREQALAKQKLEIEKDQLETELKFLRSQLNPHFLFNTINSIFVLIHKNQDMASGALAKFSDLLRYQLYECNENQIPLRQELTYLENYIELERLRLDSKRIEIANNVQKNASSDVVLIAPFILMPFIENAFKHVSLAREKTNSISIDLTLKDSILAFVVANTVSKTRSVGIEPIKQSGVGLKNVRRRLNLIYPNDHRLSIDHSDELFLVTLQIKLAEREIPVEQSLEI
jgi:sensor histidine kinase YesM